MINWILSNLSTIVVALVLLVIVGFIIRNQVKTKNTCGCGCSGCSLSGSCHSTEKK